MRIFSILLISLLLVSCSTSPSMKDAMGNCSESIRTTFSSGDVIRFTYSADRLDGANTLAENWCANRGKKAKMSATNCNGCCSTTFRCFKE